MPQKTWLQEHLGDVFVFLSAAVLLIQNDPDLKIPPVAAHWIVVLGLLAKLAHKIFFTQPAGMPATPPTLGDHP